MRTRYDLHLKIPFTCKCHLPGKEGLPRVSREGGTLSPGSFSGCSSAGLTSVVVSASWLDRNLLSTEMGEKVNLSNNTSCLGMKCWLLG